MLAQDLKPPPVYVTEADYERLSNLAGLGRTLGAELLGRELDRAIVVRPEEAPQRFVRLGSAVTYRELTSGEARRVTLVCPDQADIDAGRLSVLSPVGAALLGLCAGAAFSWSGADGRPRVVEIEAVEV
ncbi:nucleoside diphosphate kinase regulator [Phenylobacterium sp.]|uniref:nucleoside diphosphate kinase regulator n=1 Tax=Phenylobacterium sp. TaxID=1871053 RepID=UPI002CC206CB|nr:nucleoside diphosphate kinase regulator [Phenylobacterium sp.]HVI32632.1 nucleoside diphosphate kinase regulator [Phenylobacterium sp.]